ncbi:MAG: hypothetical protein FJ096_00730 [Deltaproteobacteria bacterium]|nr:hypothetical protein [Deltaproteobacteria bacterium]
MPIDPKKLFDRSLAIRLVAAAVLVLGAHHLFRTVEPHYPIRHWLGWRYVGYWAASLLWLASCVAVGHRTVRAVVRTPLPLLEQLSFDLVVGVHLFALLVFLVGVAGLLYPAAFFAIPLALLTLGGLGPWRYFRRALHRHRLPGGIGHRLGFWGVVAVLFGALALALVYFGILSPGNISFDSRWKHLAMAQHYAAVHRIERYPEGWYPGSAPQLASYLYTWALILPKARFFDRLELAQHVEFVGFAFSLLGIPALVRRMAPEVPGASTWAVRFLFPGIFLYDSNLGGGADHVAAMFTAPIALGLFRFVKRLEARHAVLLAFPIAGAILTKYSSAFELIAYPVLAVTARALYLAVPRFRARVGAAPRAWLVGPLVCIGAGLVLTASLWLKNWVWYGDPLYPLLNKVFHGKPWDGAARVLYDHSYRTQHWKPERDLTGVKESLAALWTWSFQPHDWKKFHGTVPVIGSLFTLLSVAVPLLGKRLRLWAVIAATHLGIFLWYWTNHQDRYLQSLMPWMAAVSAVVLGLLWKQGWLVRLPLALLVGLQLLWGGDVPFIPGHVFVKVPLRASIELINAGYQKKYEERFALFDYEKVGAALPRQARVMLHEQHPHLGLQRPAVHDWVSWQAGIDYAGLGHPGRIDARYRELGVTHLLWQDKASGYDSVAGDLLFRAYAHRFAKSPRKVAGFWIADLPDAPVASDAAFNDQVLFFGCTQAGLTDLRGVSAPSFGPDKHRFTAPHTPFVEAEADALAAKVGFMVVEKRCKSRHPSVASLSNRFPIHVVAKAFELHVQ